MKFVHHHILWLALAVGLLLGGFFLWSWRKRRALIAQFVSARLLPELSVGVSNVRQKVRMALALSAVIFVMLAMARPQWGFSWEEAHQRGLDIVMAIDTSRSLLAEDIKPNRLSRARLAAWDLAKLATTDRVGLVAFAGSSFLQCPLTLDDDAFRQSLDAIRVGIIPQGGSNIADAINTAASAFSKENDNHKVVIVFSDGEDHIGGAAEAAAKLAEEGVRVFTIGLGTVEGELLTVRNPDGTTDYVKDSNGAVVKSRLNEGLMKEVADAGDGFYLPLQGATTMETLYEKGLEPLPKSEYSARIVQRFHERYQWPLGIAIVLLLIEAFLPDHSLRRHKAMPAKAGTGGVAVCVLFFLMVSIGSLEASPRSAAKAFSRGDFTGALEEYQRLLEETPDDERLHFNAAAAAYEVEDFDSAHDHFSKALRSQDLDLQEKAYYGLGNTSYFMGEKAVDPNEKMSHWEKAIQHFDGALKLRPDDQNADFNREVIRQKLEALKQEQEKQEQQQSSDENQDQQEQESEGDQESEQDQQQEQDQSGDQPQDSEQQQESEQEQNQEQQSEGENSEGAGQDEESEQGNARPNEEEGDGEEAQAPVTAGEMTQEQAAQMLDAIRASESALLFAPTNRPPRGRVFFKDW